MSQIEPCDVVTVGYPRSGNTWMQGLVSALAYGVDLRLVGDALTQTLVPDVHFNTLYRRVSDTMYFKSHEAPHSRYRRVIYLVRDPRDALLSSYHFAHANGGAASLSEVMTENGWVSPYGRWSDHVSGWLDESDVELHLLRYEDLVGAPHRALADLSAFLGLEVSATRLDEVVSMSGFEVSRHRERNLGGVRYDAWGKEAGASFHRKGKIGGHSDEVPDDVVRRVIENNQLAMQRLGYLDENGGVG